MKKLAKKSILLFFTFTLALTSLLSIGQVKKAEAAESNLSDPDTFIKGVDISTLQALEDRNVKFYDGGTQQDLLTIMKNHGVNYVRLRLWNNPVQADGYNDKEHVLAMAGRVKAEGLKLLLDFHYSDFWADPGQQVKPAAWKDLSFADLKTAVYDYTRDVMSDLAEADAYPDMVQIGNEINSGMLLPDGSTGNMDNLAQLISEGTKAVRDTMPIGQSTQIMLHLAEGGSNSKFRSFFDAMEARDVDYDVIGMSYYPFWHGTFQQLKSNMDDVAARYGKQIVVAETSYPQTLENGDNHPNTVGENETKLVGLEASVANQKLVTETVLNTVAHVQGGLGLGVFYWEPAWLAGVGWKQGEGNAWENQAMFDYEGNALDSLNAFQYVPGSMSTIDPILVYPATPVTIATGDAFVLPADAKVLYNEGTITAKAVEWDEYDSELANTPGTFTVQGDVAGTALRTSVEVTVTGSPNLLKDGSFESGTLSDWTVTGDSGAVKIEHNAGNAKAGEYALNYWSGSAFAYEVTQTVTGLENGTYELRGYASGGEYADQVISLTAETGGQTYSAPVTNAGFNVWKPYTVGDIQVTDGQIKVGISVNGPANAWGYFDKLELVKAEAVEVNVAQNPGFENGALTPWTITGETGAAKVEHNAANAKSGEYALNYWFGTAFKYVITQSLENLDNGIYELRASASGGVYDDQKISLYAKSGGKTYSANIVNTGWNDWHSYTVSNIEVRDGKVSFGFDLDAPAGAWGYMDDIALVRTGDLPSGGDDNGNGGSIGNGGAVGNGDVATIISSQLAEDGKGGYAVTLPEGTTQVILPSGLYDQLERGPITLSAGNLSVTIPTSVAADLLAKLKTEAGSKITLSFVPVTGDAAEKLLGSTGENVRSLSTIYNFELSVTDAAGNAEKLSVFSSPLTLRMKALQNGNPELTGIYYMGEDGSIQYAGGQLANGVWEASVTHFSSYALLEFDKSYTDVPATHWALQAITSLSAKQILNGTSASSYEPEREISRAGFTAILVRALKLASGTDHTPHFSDVPASAWYADAVSAAYKAGLVKGRSSVQFVPNGTITRQEMAVMLAKAYEISHKAAVTSASGVDLPFWDKTLIADWALPSVQWAYEQGLLKGRGGDRFAPAASMTRAEAAEVIYRLLK
ncbi:glycosyl hydrolase 53 family protein [Paenibacillus glycanilyticus]|uniref:glycosyl hydrolase 53 family protein n=1 Tax=Paenibacillus glycanilyticus TaxID=126569 RepID=UPI00203B6BC5|nr:glycosyl hydrolase 53 family protein [Paenibacillus glycanilyticus]MCM3629185.1 glycosyl hydrolase 53 family protein [Paenibacillus glycanilyticus]